MIRAGQFAGALVALAVGSAPASAAEPARRDAILTCKGLAPLPIVFIAGDPPTATMAWHGRPLTLQRSAAGASLDTGMRYTARLDSGLLAITARREEAVLEAPGEPPTACRVADG